MLHLQYYPHFSPTLKHSQYFLRQPVFRQLHPFAEEPFCPKFIDDLIIISSIALALTSLNSAVFWQHSQLQFWQKDPKYITNDYPEQSIRSITSSTLTSCNCTLFAYVNPFNRSLLTVCVFDRLGNYQGSWESRRFDSEFTLTLNANDLEWWWATEINRRCNFYRRV